MIIRTDDQRSRSTLKEKVTQVREQRTVVEDVQAAAKRGKIVVIVRLSDKRQKDQSFATVQQQRDAAERSLASVGLKLADAEIVEAIGESGQQWANRHKFKAILQEATRGEITVMVFPRHSRAGRNARDTQELLEAVANANGFLLAEGGIYDLSDPSQKASASQQAVLSQQDVEQRTKTNIALKLARARVRAYRIPLPTPLIWVPWRDQEYLEALERAEISEWLPQIQSIGLGTLAWSQKIDIETREVTEYVPGPYPDKDAFKSAQLRIEWYKATGSIAEVLRRIHEHSDYPAGKHGLVPYFKKRKWSSTLTLAWVPAKQGTLERWLKYPALYGIYSYTAELGKKMKKCQPDRARTITPTVFVPDAFPGFGSPDHWERIAALGATASRPKAKYLAERGERLQVEVRCGHPIAGGLVCGHLVSPFYMAKRRAVVWRSTGCGFKSGRYTEPYGHTTGMNAAELEQAIFDAVLWAHDPDTTQRAIDAFEIKADTVLEQRAGVMGQMAKVEQEMEAAARNAHAHERDGRKTLAAKARILEGKWESDYNALEAQLADLGRPEELAALSRKEEASIRRLAADVHAVLGARSASRATTLKLIAALELKAWIRRIGEGAYEVDVEFPTGVVLRQFVMTRRIRSTQTQAAWAAARFAQGADATEIAHELNAVRLHAVPHLFTPARVTGAAVQFRLSNHYPGLPAGALHPGAVSVDAFRYDLAREAV